MPTTISEPSTISEQPTIPEYDLDDNGEKVIGLTIDVITPINLDCLDSDTNDEEIIESTKSCSTQTDPKQINRLKPKQRRFKDRNVQKIV